MTGENDKIARNKLIRQTVVRLPGLQQESYSDLLPLQFGVGAALAALPLGYALWKYPSVRSKLYPKAFRGSSAPPPRRLATQVASIEVPSPSANVQLPNGRFTVQDHTEEGITSFFPARHEITQSNAWLAFRSFFLATLGVTIVFGTGTAFLVWKWDIRNIDDFHQKMRARIQVLVPSISDSRRSTSDMIKKTISQEAVDSWTWDGAKERLSQAYEQSPEIWVTTAMRELELSYQNDLQQRNSSKERSN
ncbi:hypothetical protein FRC17_002439 [Serendipita sp. 399]|nr:hypothetical protein FRC17_002439 [Serendipita sp. 399]